MSAPFDPASWVRRAKEAGLAIVTESGIQISADACGPEIDELLAEWHGGSEEQRRCNTRAACAYVHATV
jgi:hypothetical protein